MSIEKAAEFLIELWRPVPQGLIEIRGIPNKNSAGEALRRRWFSSVHEALEYGAADSSADSASGMFFGVAKRARKGGTKADVLGITSLWADIDTINMGLETDSCLKALHELPDALKPSAVIYSGGGLHAYWFLREPIVDQSRFKEVEAANAVLAHLVAGDHVGNVDRILRLPGTWNTKRGRQVARQCEVAYLNHWRAFDLANLVKAAQAHSSLFGQRGKPQPAAPAEHGWTSAHQNVDLETLWLRRVRYHAPSGYVGVNEGITRTVAKLYYAGWPAKRIVEEVLKRVRRVQASQAPSESWDWEKEARSIEYSLERLRAKSSPKGTKQPG